MLISIVSVHVKPEHIQAFKAAIVENARNSVKEPGVARFDVIQRSDDPAYFLLIEAYRNADALAQHKETAHYKTWRDTVVDMMAEPRTAIRYENVFPDDTGWG
jgi:(4S)-4-hydroxy-5-phosphonooxypentane-2,3-dione isomerase